MNEERKTDLTALDLTSPRHEALTARILERSALILARYGRRRSPVTVLASWIRPALAAAALVIVAALAALLSERPRDAGAVTTTSEALGFPAPVVAWTEGAGAPSLEELVVSLDLEVPVDLEVSR